MLCGRVYRRRLATPVTLLFRARQPCRTIQTFAEGDYVWLHHRDGMRPHWRQIPPQGGFIRTRKGAVPAAAVVGRSSGDTIETSTQELLRLTQPTLEEHVLYVDRVVTPIYPRDANLIVSRLDLHPDPPTLGETSSSAPPLEILEAGTGMGGLSLFLARALHATNPPGSASLRATSASDPTTLSPESAAALLHYKLQRRAILHTIERNSAFAANARRVIGSFCGGMYAPTIDQHVDDVGTWLQCELNARNEAFLAHIILDLPNAEDYVPLATQALKPDGLLMLWTPSISQVEQAVRRIVTDKLSLVLDEVLEVGTNLSGGRKWMVQLAQLKQQRRESVEHDVETASSVDTETSEEADQTSSTSNKEYSAEASQVTSTESTDMPRFGMVARPRVVTLSGGGFLSIFRRRWDGEQDGLPREKWAKGELKASTSAVKVRRKKSLRRSEGE